MIKNAKLITTLAALLVSLPAAADEPSPTGEWAVENGEAHVRILRCGDALWGALDWLKAPGTDENNPDETKRTRPLLGLPILREMKQDTTRWLGKIYNSENGKIYNGNISFVTADTLHIEGCVLGGWLCGGENWKRIDTKSDLTLSCNALKEY
jgi:uncharacterized protein (DUF2147 family)